MSLLRHGLMLIALAPAVLRAQGTAAHMAPLDQYLMADRAAEIALARSAAPAAISAHAQILVLGRHGYEIAAAGTNGFVCMVERGWMAPFDDPHFWSPRIRGAVCYNPAAVRSIVPLTERRTALVLMGLPRAQILDSMKAGAHHEPAPGAMAYMLSRHSHLDDVAGPWRPHLMFYAPLADSGRWGADVPGSPVISQPQFVAEGQAIMTFVVPVPAWSDGTPQRSVR